ncbi:hypothetical protein JKF63_01447 [Porcisia hertigi]|uniref:BART domain-containing protein n=1 Tax=Porcisia hertigi TaxID=2761500 RepID=A0A836H3A0_9TRYP|nr:hypothetical protein JKF63_01447 [Porcisia hertigi]
MSITEETPVDAHALLPDAKIRALLDELDAFFSKGSNTDRLRQFIEENDDTFSLVTSEDKLNTNTEASLRLYQLFQKYAVLVENIIEDFVATKKTRDEALLRSLASAIQDEWKSPNTAYRCVCTSYIVASMDYNDFLELAEDLYSMTHYQMFIDEEDDSEEDDSEDVVDGTSAGGNSLGDTYLH